MFTYFYSVEATRENGHIVSMDGIIEKEKQISGKEDYLSTRNEIFSNFQNKAIENKIVLNSFSMVLKSFNLLNPQG